MRFDLICIDLFQTLVDLQPRIPLIWQRILGGGYDETFVLRCVDSVVRNVVGGFHKGSAANRDFMNLRAMFGPFFQTVREEMNLDFEVDKAVDIYIEEHNQAEPFADADEFFAQIQGKLPVCLVSDADCDMVTRVLERYRFDSVFLSETSRSYKNEPESKIFKEVLNHYSIEPKRVLHIGDSVSDILGAHRVGIHTCWINRENAVWQHEVKPDYIINRLPDIMNLL